MPERTQPLCPTEREWVVLAVALATLRSNLDAVRDAMSPEDAVHDADGPTEMVLGDTRVPALTEAEVIALEESIRDSPIFRKIKVKSGTYEPDHLLGVVNSFRRNCNSEPDVPWCIRGSYIDAYAVENARLVYAKRDKVPGYADPVTDALLVADDLGVYIVKLGDDHAPEVAVHPARLEDT